MNDQLKSLHILNSPHRRYNPLTGEWVLVSPQRTQRPWLGQVEKSPARALPAYDPDCYLCPGNPRAGGKRNPDYSSTFVFDNDFPALLEFSEAESSGYADPNYSQEIFLAEPEYGICRVVCFSPRHDLTLPELPPAKVEDVVRTWIDQTRDLSCRNFVRYIQIFENKGAMMGASNPHPHSQVWATSHTPTEAIKELRGQSEHLQRAGTCLLCKVLEEEIHSGERVVVANPHFTALVPFWAIWPFEILLLSNRHVSRLTDLDGEEVTALADILRRVTARYDNLFEISFPYSMGFHQAPFDGDHRSGESGHEGWHLHAHFYPPLLRSASVRKFMVGFELLASPQRDLTPEAAAERLRNLSDRHYLMK